MFKFHFNNFDLEDGLQSTHTDEQVPSNLEKTTDRTKLGREAPGPASETSCTPLAQQDTELSIDNLLVSLPPVLSYSPIVIPLSPKLQQSGNNASTHDSNELHAPFGSTSHQRHSITLPRRDLFDARYQLIQEDGESTNAANAAPQATEAGKDELAFFDDPSDLVPGVYEGGLKTWECALSLVESLDGLHNAERDFVRRIRGKRVLEIGCGTAIPSIYLLCRLFEELAAPMNVDEAQSCRTEFVLQDYNALVLRLVTFPNIILAWYASPLAKSLRESAQSATDEDASPFDVNQQGDLNTAQELKSAFQQSLKEHNISLRLIAGSWEAMLGDNAEGQSVATKAFDIILTSETIYQPSSLETLISLLERACGRKSDAHSRLSSNEEGGEEACIEKGVQGLGLSEDDGRLCLVAAKVLYFGVGGGILDFERSVESHGGRTTTILHHESGVGRKVLRVQW